MTKSNEKMASLDQQSSEPPVPASVARFRYSMLRCEDYFTTTTRLLTHSLTGLRTLLILIVYVGLCPQTVTSYPTTMQPPTTPTPTHNDSRLTSSEMLVEIIQSLDMAKLVIDDAYSAYMCTALLPPYYTFTHDNCSHYSQSMAASLTEPLPSLDVNVKTDICCGEQEFAAMHVSKKEIYATSVLLESYVTHLAEIAALEEGRICFSPYLDGLSCIYRKFDSCWAVEHKDRNYFLCVVEMAMRHARDAIRELRALNACICTDDPPSSIIPDLTHSQRYDRTLAVLHETTRSLTDAHSLITIRRILVDTGSLL